jgi:hypothetical protein
MRSSCGTWKRAVASVSMFAAPGSVSVPHRCVVLGVVAGPLVAQVHMARLFPRHIGADFSIEDSVRKLTTLDPLHRGYYGRE